MKRVVKWTLISAGGLIALVILVLIAAPMFIELDRHKPMIEKTVTEATGRPFRLAGELDLSLFPWTGIALSELHLGNPPGFENEDMLFVKSFEVRVKLFPLLFKDLEVKRFVLEGARLVLEKQDDGTANWEGMGGEPPAAVEPEERAGEAEPQEVRAFPLESLAVGDFSVSGSALWLDHATGVRKEISDLTLKLKDVSLDRPVGISLSAQLDKQPLSLEGSLGPLGADPMNGSVPLDLIVEAFGELELGVSGRLKELGTRQAFDLALNIPPFSPRKVVSALGRSFPVETTDPRALSRVALQAKAQGDPTEVSVSDGVLELDQTRMTFTSRVREFERPDLRFAIHADRLDLDRYLPPPSEGAARETEPAGSSDSAGKTDYGPLRKLVLDGEVRVDELKAKGLSVSDILVKVGAKGGVLTVDPLDASLYEGKAASRAQVDVRGDEPKLSLETDMEGIQAGPLVRDLAQKDIIEGRLRASISVTASGEQVEAVKKTLNGKGELLFKDGAIVGVDLPGMARNAKAAFGLAEKTEERPKTDFSELHAPFTIKDGVVETKGTTMASPLLRLSAAGKADLVSEALDFRVEPTFVATLKGQGDATERSGIRVPILVSGTFSSPKFRPDLEGMIKGKLKEGVPDAEGIKEMISPGQEGGKESEDTKEKAEGLLKGLLGQ